MPAPCISYEPHVDRSASYPCCFWGGGGTFPNLWGLYQLLCSNVPKAPTALVQQLRSADVSTWRFRLAARRAKHQGFRIMICMAKISLNPGKSASLLPLLSLSSLPLCASLLLFVCVHGSWRDSWLETFSQRPHISMVWRRDLQKQGQNGGGEVGGGSLQVLYSIYR